jgi:lipopolysaccharide export system permease protein
MKNLVYVKLFKDINLFFFISIISLAVIIWIIQAVNFLDLVSEEGHGLRVYFLYTVFSLPKIISKILPFVFLISLFYVIFQYDRDNELLIFWIIGETKLKFINIIILISFVYFLIQIILSIFIVPFTQDKARSYFRNSDVNLFSSIIKEKKFIDVMENLTIFVDKREKDQLKNIIIKEIMNDEDSQIIIAKDGVFINEKEKKIISLKFGKIINTRNDNQNIIDFDKFDFRIDQFSSNTITNPKIQEMSSKNLLRCMLLIFNDNNENKANKNNYFLGCNTEIQNAIYEEFLKRFCTPLFILVIGIMSSFMIIADKNSKNYNISKFISFIITVGVIFYSEIALDYASSSYLGLLFYIISFFTFFLTIYYIQYYKIYKDVNSNT